jgi:hypothetical protein
MANQGSDPDTYASRVTIGRIPTPSEIIHISADGCVGVDGWRNQPAAARPYDYPASLLVIPTRTSTPGWILPKSITKTLDSWPVTLWHVLCG